MDCTLIIFISDARETNYASQCVRINIYMRKTKAMLKITSSFILFIMLKACIRLGEPFVDNATIRTKGEYHLFFVFSLINYDEDRY